MGKEKKMNLKLKNDEFSKRWVVYGLFDVSTNQPVFVGCLKLTSLFTLSDARAALILNPDTETIVMLLDTFDSRADAMVCQAKHLQRLGLTITPRSRAKAVRCVTTGETFASAQDAVNAHGLSYSALSNHLNRRAGYITVKGKTYERIDNIDHLRAQGLVRDVPPTPEPWKGD